MTTSYKYANNGHLTNLHNDLEHVADAVVVAINICWNLRAPRTLKKSKMVSEIFSQRQRWIVIVRGQS